jgi:copper resistance protein C
MMRKVQFVVSILILGILFTGNAWAHAFLSSAVPAVGSTVVTGPKELRLHFSEAVEVKFSNVKITMEGGKDIGPNKTAADPSDPQMIVVTLTAPLAPGVYLVRWRVVSVDTHKTQGDYRFTIKR